MASQEHMIEKQAVIDEIKAKLDKAQSAVVINYMGINVAEANGMRKRLREANVDYSVYKNSLVNRAIKGTAFESLEEVLSGPSAFAFSYEDAVTPARLLNDMMKEYKKMSFKGGVVEGQFFDGEGIKTIATLPTRDQLISKFMGSVQSPLSKLVRTFQAIADDKQA